MQIYANADIDMHLLHKNPQNRTRRAGIASRAAISAPVYTCIFNPIYRLICNIGVYTIKCIYAFIDIKNMTYASIHIYEQICLEQWLQQLLSSSRRIVRLVQHVALATQRLGIHKYAYMCIYIYVYTNK